MHFIQKQNFSSKIIVIILKDMKTVESVIIALNFVKPVESVIYVRQIIMEKVACITQSFSELN